MSGKSFESCSWFRLLPFNVKGRTAGVFKKKLNLIFQGDLFWLMPF